MPPEDRNAALSPDVSAGETTGPAPVPDAGDAWLLSRRPSAIGLARLSQRRLFPPGGIKLYRHIIRLVELGPEREFLLAPCGRGVTAQFLAESSGAAGAGVDPDAAQVEAAVARAREAGLSARLHVEQAPLDDLPYQDAVFDVAIGEIGLAASADPAAAVRELVRVTKPMGSVVLIQLIWTGHVEPERRDALVESLGVRPLLLIEWKQLLRDAGVVELYVEDWSDAAALLRQPWATGGVAGLGTLGDRLAVLLRAWRQWGWTGLRQALRAKRQVRTLVRDERLLGLSLIKGTKWQAHPDQGT